MKKYLIISAGIVTLSLILNATLLKGQTALCLIIGIVGVIAMFFSLFERKEVVTEKIVLIAIMAALACVGRVIFAWAPSVQPASFIIMLAGIAFGKEVGFLTGAITALASNLILGQGPWTIWQMFCWGMMGLLSAVLRNLLAKKAIAFASYGFIWGFIFGFVMNGWFLFGGFAGEVTAKAFVASMITSFPMDLAHAITNLLLCFLFGKRFIQLLSRIAIKYGLREPTPQLQGISHQQ